MRYLFGFVCALALSVTGCSETTGTGGSGGTAGDGGSGGDGGTGGMAECQGPEDCDDREECTTDTCAGGFCENTPVEDGTACAEGNECAVGECTSGVCELTPVSNDTACGDDKGTCQDGTCEVACSEQGIRDALAAGGGPYTFDCAGPTTVVTEVGIAIDNNVVLDGGGNLTVEAGESNIAFVFLVNEGVAAGLTGFTVTGGNCDAISGCSDGIKNAGGTLALRNSKVSGSADNGIENEGTMTVNECTVLDNSGLGIYNGHMGTLAVMNSTVSGNDDGGIDNDGVATVINSTISGNTASGIFNEGSLMLLHATLSGNSGEDGAALSTGPRPDPKYMTTIANTLIDGDCENEQPVTSNGYNIESPGNTCGFDQTGDQPSKTATELNLGPLANNGGPTMTHKPGDGGLGEGSVAIDAIPGDACEVDTDQRGEPRPEAGGTMCDVGSVEVQP